jgi:hypothetical protein
VLSVFGAGVIDCRCCLVFAPVQAPRHPGSRNYPRDFGFRFAPAHDDHLSLNRGGQPIPRKIPRRFPRDLAAISRLLAGPQCGFRCFDRFRIRFAFRRPRVPCAGFNGLAGTRPGARVRARRAGIDRPGLMLWRVRPPASRRARCRRRRAAWPPHAEDRADHTCRSPAGEGAASGRLMLQRTEGLQPARRRGNASRTRRGIARDRAFSPISLDS